MKEEIKVGSEVYAEITNAEGIVQVIHDGAAKIQITKGDTSITDYYMDDLNVIKR
ncbi:hypothetical protein [Paenibacillus medicaginis]|uniref:Uncharacterized protein n=1 Tax=Paenibacillus medicaginis TaxID=1470560 RepID=A0ABV5BUS2_9BACL